jgi:hypothetical protein
MQNPENIPLKPRVFPPIKEGDNVGDGDFGHWGLDDANLPCYHYTMNQLTNRHAYYVNSEGIERRDHWHQIGNKRVTGLASFTLQIAAAFSSTGSEPTPSSRRTR